MPSPTAEVSFASKSKVDAPCRETAHMVLQNKAVHHNRRAIAYGVLADLTGHLRGVEEEAVYELLNSLRIWEDR